MATRSSTGMVIVEQGRGTPLVFLCGMQGRWEYARPTIDALANDFRVVTFGLCDEPAARFPFDRARAIDSYTAQVEAALDRAGVTRAVVCGVSFGGVIALRFAASHPGRVGALVLASTPGPGFHLRAKHELYTRVPWIFGPVFLAESPWRLRRELRAALPDRRARHAFRLWAARTFVTAPLSMSRMAARARLIQTFDIAGDCARVTAPTLVLTGEPGLDHVVPVSGSSALAPLIAGARTAVLERSGHMGSITRPHAFAALVRDFVAGHRHAAA